MMKQIKCLYLEAGEVQILMMFEERQEQMTLVNQLLIDLQKHLWMIFRNVKPLKLIFWLHIRTMMHHFGFYHPVIDFEDSVNFLLSLVMATVYMLHYLHQHGVFYLMYSFIYALSQ